MPAPTGRERASVTGLGEDRQLERLGHLIDRPDVTVVAVKAMQSGQQHDAASSPSHSLAHFLADRDRIHQNWVEIDERQEIWIGAPNLTSPPIVMIHALQQTITDFGFGFLASLAREVR